MKIFTQEEFDAFECNELNLKICPTGDYSNIKTIDHCSFGGWCSFGKACSFGESCSFGEWCSFGESCSFENKKMKTGNPYIALDRCGSVGRKVYIFNCDDGLFVRAGCFFGTAKEFLAAALKDCRGNKKAVKYVQYSGFVKIARATFERDS